VNNVGAMNNAAWCDAVCRARGAKTRYERALWINEDPSPPYYPNIVTLAPGLPLADVAGIVDRLRRSPQQEFAIKDSFSDLPLDALGMQLLFDAEWLWRAPTALPTRRRSLQWKRVDRAAELADWEAAWWPQRSVRPCAPGSIYAAGLLADPAVTLIAGHDGERLVAGVACTVAAGAVGLTCLFLPSDGDSDALRDELFLELATRFPGLPWVDYETGEEQATLQRHGFRAVGPLRVWFST
jgi:hypothetical protein